MFFFLQKILKGWRKRGEEIWIFFRKFKNSQILLKIVTIQDSYQELDQAQELDQDTDQDTDQDLDIELDLDQDQDLDVEFKA